MSRARQRLGRRGEDVAAELLEGRGMEVVARNWRCAYGEIDLVARDGDALVFVEVRTRRSRRLGTPEESITAAKRDRLIELSLAYVAEHGWEGPWRIDVVAIEMGGDGQLIRIEHLRSAVEAGD
ncbi:MAG: YraN family protein [Anaerolineae bacterium]